VKKGTRVIVQTGKDRGKEGVVFWVGKAKFGSGLRVGLKTEGGETVWAAESAIREASDDAPPDAPAEQAKPAAFRFYGDHPADWIEGASDGHGFSVQFVGPPTSEGLRTIATLYQSMLSKGPASPSRGPWEWSERFAHFHVGERWTAGAAILGPVLRLLWKVHATCPIRDVVYFNAREGAGGPEQPPDPGPAGWHYFGQFRRQTDPALPPLATIEAFEEVRLAAALATWERDTREQIDQEIKAQRGEKGIRLEHFDGEGPTFPPPPGEAPTVSTAADRLIVQTGAGERRELALPEGSGDPGCVAAHPDGGRALVGGRDFIVEVDLATGSVRPRRVPARGEALQDLTWLEGESWAALTADRLYVLEPGADGDAIVDALDVRRSGLQPLLGGRVVAAFSSIGKPEFFALAHRQLKRLGATKARIDDVVEHEGRLLATFEHQTDAPRSWYELLGLEEALDALVAKKPRKKRSAKPVIETITHDALPDELRSSRLARSPVELEREWNGLFAQRFEGWVSEFTAVPAARSSRGVLATVVEPTTILVSHEEGQVRKLRKFRKGQDVTQLEFDPTGRYLFACCRGLVTRFDLDDGFRRETVHDDPSKPMQICAVSGERLLAYFLTGVCQVALEDGAWALKGVKKVPRYATAALSPALETVFLVDSSKGARAFAAVGDKMLEVWKWSSRCTRASFVGPRVFLHLDWVEQFPAAEVLGLEAALEAKRRAPVRKKARASKKPGTKKPEVVQQVIEPASVPDDAHEQAVYAHLGIQGETGELRCRQSAAGLRGALCDPAGGGYYRTLVIDGERGPRRTDISGISSVGGFDLAPDGSVYLARLQGFLRLDPDTGEPAMLHELNMHKRPTSYGRDVAALGEDVLLALSSRRVELLRRDETGAWQAVSKRNVKQGERLFPLRSLGLAVILTGHPQERVLLLGIGRNDRLQILSKLGGWLAAFRVVDDRVFVRTVNDEAWELTGLAAVAESLG